MRPKGPWDRGCKPARQRALQGIAARPELCTRSRGPYAPHHDEAGPLPKLFACGEDGGFDYPRRLRRLVYDGEHAPQVGWKGVGGLSVAGDVKTPR